MATSETDFKHPLYELLEEKGSKAMMDYFLQEDGVRLKFVSLGEALDFVSYGFSNGVGYHMSPKDVMKFIRKWMSNQEPRREFVREPITENSYRIHENISQRKYHYEFNRFNRDGDVSLTDLLISNDSCPRDKKHKGTLFDRAGRLRCGHMETNLIAPNYDDTLTFFDRFSQCKKISYVPISGLRLDAGDEVEGKDICYSIIKEPQDKYFPLQTIIERLNVFKSEKRYANPFSGFTLAAYVKAWWNQPGKNLVWANKADPYRVCPEFVCFSSD